MGELLHFAEIPEASPRRLICEYDFGSEEVHGKVSIGAKVWVAEMFREVDLYGAIFGRRVGVCDISLEIVEPGMCGTLDGDEISDV
jgi:hypothetical protein